MTASHRNFMKNFTEKLPPFLRNRSNEVYEDIVNILTEGIKGDGVEIRGAFSMKKKENSERNTILFKDFKNKDGK